MSDTARQATGEKQRERDNLLSKAYSHASSDLRKAHLDEFTSYMEKHTKALGVEWKPKLTPEQTAEREFQRLLSQHPWLRDRMPAVEPEEAPGQSDPDL